jgi:hypothetical protein
MVLMENSLKPCLVPNHCKIIYNFFRNHNRGLLKLRSFKAYSNFPNYMANTQSSKDKLRSHSAPKQRPEVNNSVYMVNRKNELSKRKRKCLSNSTNSVMNHQRCLGQNADDVSAVLSL